MKIITPFLFLSLFLFSLQVKSQDQSLKQGDNTMLASIKKRTDTIEDYVVKHNNQLILFAKVPGKKTLVRVRNNKWPDNVDYSYNLLKDSAGKVIFLVQMPYSESGDWYIEYRYFFDSNGKTVAFERVTNVFDSSIKGGVIYETLTKYYSSDFELLGKIYTLKNKYGKNIKDSGHVDIYHYPFHINQNLSDCLKAYLLPVD